jgi:hypothetical protein
MLRELADRRLDPKVANDAVKLGALSAIEQADPLDAADASLLRAAKAKQR